MIPKKIDIDLSMTTSNHGVSRFNDYDQGFNQEEHEDVQYIFNGDSYDGRMEYVAGAVAAAAKAMGDGIVRTVRMRTRIHRANWLNATERGKMKNKGREARPTSPLERERGWNDDIEVPRAREEVGSGYGSRMTDRERARAKA